MAMQMKASIKNGQNTADVAKMRLTKNSDKFQITGNKDMKASDLKFYDDMFKKQAQEILMRNQA